MIVNNHVYIQIQQRRLESVIDKQHTKKIQKLTIQMMYTRKHLCDPIYFTVNMLEYERERERESYLYEIYVTQNLQYFCVKNFLPIQIWQWRGTNGDMWVCKALNLRTIFDLQQAETRLIQKNLHQVLQSALVTKVYYSIFKTVTYNQCLSEHLSSSIDSSASTMVHF